MTCELTLSAIGLCTDASMQWAYGSLLNWQLRIAVSCNWNFVAVHANVTVVCTQANKCMLAEATCTFWQRQALQIPATYDVAVDVQPELATLSAVTSSVSASHSP